MSTAGLMERKAKLPKVALKEVQTRKRRKRKWAATPDSSSREREALLIREALNLTFECERFHCRLFQERCIQRQESWDPEIYEGCIDCKQGLMVAQKMSHKNKEKKAA